jgi:hypothetical protein
MKIQINDEYRISSDSNQWMVQKYRGIDKKTGEPIWQSILYYTSLDTLVTGLADKMLRESDASTISEALVEIKRIGELLKSALSVED